MLEDCQDFGFVGTLSDTTAQTRLDQGSNLLAFGFQALIAADRAAVVVVDQALHVLFMNADFSDTLGLSDPCLPEPLLTRLILRADLPDATKSTSISRTLSDHALNVFQGEQALHIPSGLLLVDGHELGAFRLDMVPIVEASSPLRVIVRLQRLQS